MHHSFSLHGNLLVRIMGWFDFTIIWSRNWMLAASLEFGGQLQSLFMLTAGNFSSSSNWSYPSFQRDFISKNIVLQDVRFLPWFILIWNLPLRYQSQDLAYKSPFLFSEKHLLIDHFVKSWMGYALQLFSRAAHNYKALFVEFQCLHMMGKPEGCAHLD